LKQRYAAKFEELKVHSSSKLAALVKPATKLITASNNGSIIVFDDEVDVVLFNEFIKTYDGLMEINKFFGKLIYFIGITKEQLSTFTNEYLLLQKSGERFNEPDVSVLEKIIRNKNSITQLAFDIFNK
jgi:hypothetical protein